MEDYNPPRGLIAAPVTPLNEDGTLDVEGLKRLLGRIIKSCHALFLASPFAGEGHLLDTNTLQDLLHTAVSIVRGKIPILMWISGRSSEETFLTLERLRNILERESYAGPVFWVDCPLLYRSNRGLLEHCFLLAEKAARPLILSNDAELVDAEASPLKRKNIRTTILGEIARLDKVKGLLFKGSLDRLYNYTKVINRVRGFPIYEGDEGRFLASPGLNGVVSVGANLLPETWTRVTAFCLDISGEKTIYPDHLMQIWKMGRLLRELLDAYKKHPAAVLKAVLASMGVIKSSKCLSAPGKDIEPMVRKALEITKEDDHCI